MNVCVGCGGAGETFIGNVSACNECVSRAALELAKVAPGCGAVLTKGPVTRLLDAIHTDQGKPPLKRFNTMREATDELARLGRGRN